MGFYRLSNGTYWMDREVVSIGIIIIIIIHYNIKHIWNIKIHENLSHINPDFVMTTIIFFWDTYLVKLVKQKHWLERYFQDLKRFISQKIRSIKNLVKLKKVCSIHLIYVFFPKNHHLIKIIIFFFFRFQMSFSLKNYH